MTIKLDFGEGGIITAQEYYDILIETMGEDPRYQDTKGQLILDQIRSNFNTMSKLMRKKHNTLHPNEKVSISDVLNMPFQDWVQASTEFQEKYKITSKLPFLEKSSEQS